MDPEEELDWPAPEAVEEETAVAAAMVQPAAMQGNGVAAATGNGGLWQQPLQPGVQPAERAEKAGEGTDHFCRFAIVEPHARSSAPVAEIRDAGRVFGKRCISCSAPSK